MNRDVDLAISHIMGYTVFKHNSSPPLALILTYKNNNHSCVVQLFALIKDPKGLGNFLSTSSVSMTLTQATMSISYDLNALLLQRIL